LGAPAYIAFQSQTHKRLRAHTLRELRNKWGYTQQELAKRRGTTKQTVGRWETGRVAIPTPALKDLAVCLGTTADYLLCGSTSASYREAPGLARAKQDVARGGPLHTGEGHRRGIPLQCEMVAA
jgi:transcriptional regulator with XRE-family HTH domain